MAKRSDRIREYERDNLRPTRSVDGTQGTQRSPRSSYGSYKTDHTGGAGAFIRDDMSAFSLLPRESKMAPVGKTRMIMSSTQFPNTFRNVENQMNEDLRDIKKIMMPGNW